MEQTKIKIDQTLLTCVAQSLGRIPETMYDFQKVKNLSCGGRPIYQRLIDPYNDNIPERLEIVEGDFSVIGKMSRLKKLTISAMPIRDFSFLKTCIALESLEISGCGVIDCADLSSTTSLKSLSLHYCSGLEHMEEILKLFRLKKLSLEGTMITDADCFINCWIPEVHLPEHILREKRKAEKAAAGKKNAKAKCRAGVPFKPAKRGQEEASGRCSGQQPYTLESLDSPLWETYRGAYGNVSEYLAILTAKREEAPETFRLRRLERAVKTNYEIVFDNLFENLYHQMSFYQATWLVMPYLAKLMEAWEKDKDTEWLFQGIMAAGSCLATDIFGERPQEECVYESYQNAVAQIRDITIDFLAGNMEYVLEKEVSWRQEFAVAVTAVLGEKKLAYMLFLSGFGSCYIVCPTCENCDEEIEFGYCEPSEKIRAAGQPSKKWDGESMGDVKQWLFNLFDLIEDSEGKERLSYYFGTYTCPECGEETPVLKGMEEYYG